MRWSSSVHFQVPRALPPLVNSVESKYSLEPLYLLCSYGYEHDRLQSVKILLDAGCDAHSRNIRGETPVHLAARFGFISILEDKHTASP